MRERERERKREKGQKKSAIFIQFFNCLIARIGLKQVSHNLLLKRIIIGGAI